jgi:hypothetical protein
MKLTIKQITEAMLQQIHIRLRAHRLREGYKSKDDFDISKVVRPGSISKWEGKSAKTVFTAAKKNDPTALEYIFWKMKGAIHGAFWANYLGPNGTIRAQRINNESAWEQWLSIAWMSMVGGFKEGGADEEKRGGAKGALDSFDPAKIAEDRVWNVFAMRYKMILKNSAVQANISQRGGGIKHGTGEDVMQYEPTWVEKGIDTEGDDLGRSEKGGSYQDETFDKVNTSIEVEKFLKKWGDYSQSAALQTGTKGVTPAMVFYEALSNPKAELRAMGTKFGVSRNTCQTLLAKAQQEMENYDISGQDLMTAIREIGNEKIASYLQPVDAVAEEAKPAPKEQEEKPVKAVAKAGPKSSFEDKFKAAMADDDAWAGTNRGCDAANYLYYWIESGFKDPKAVANQFDLRGSDAVWWERKGRKLLKKHSITLEDIKSAVKAKGKKKITDLIGDDNDGSW